MTTTITSHHFLSTCSVLGSVLDLEGGFKQDKRHHPVLQAACYLIWELKLSQMMRSKNSNKHYFTKMGSRKKVHAFVRVRPTDDFAHEMIKYRDDNKTIDIHLKKDSRRGVVNNQQTDWSFKLDRVLHDASQDLVYETVAKDVVSQALNGFNARKEGASSPLSGKDLDVSTSKTQLTPSSKDGDVKDMVVRDRETSNTEPLASDSPKEELRPPRPSTPPAKPVAFEDFKNERGSEINRIFKENKSILNERRKRASETTQRINAIKREIDMTKEALNLQKSLREKQGEYENKGLMIIDEEEFLLILKLKDLKKQYRTEYQDLRDLRAEIQYCQHLVDQCRHRLLTEFDIWYNESFFVPEDLQMAVKPGGSIRPGMMPLSKIVSLGEDDQDRFSQLQQTTLPEGPDSVSFYNAKVKMEQKHNYLKTMMGLQQAHRK